MKVAVNCDWCGNIKIITRKEYERYKNFFCNMEHKTLWNSENRIGKNAANWKGGGVKVNCAFCGTEKEVEKWHYKRNIENKSNFFCDIVCEGKYRSLYLVGENSAHWQGGKIKTTCCNPRCNIEIFVTRSVYNKFNNNFCSPTCQYDFYKGENHYCWKGGGEDYYPPEFSDELRLKIRQRDNFSCQLCFERENGYIFSVHHIDYNKFNNDERNLILLCRSCHSKTNFNRDYWLNYFINIYPSQAMEVA